MPSSSVVRRTSGAATKQSRKYSLEFQRAGVDRWGRLTQTTAEVRYFRFAGNHFFLHSAEQLVLSRIAEELTKLIAHQPLGG